MLRNLTWRACTLLGSACTLLWESAPWPSVCIVPELLDSALVFVPPCETRSCAEHADHEQLAVGLAIGRCSAVAQNIPALSVHQAAPGPRQDPANPVQTHQSPVRAADV